MSTDPRSVFVEAASAQAYRKATVRQVRAHLSGMIREVEAGATIIITRRGKDIAKLERIEGGPRIPGSMRGQLPIDDRFFEPLPEDELRTWEGG